MSCPSCVAKIESNLKQLDGVADVTVHFNSGRIDITHDTSRVDVERLRSVIREIGYETAESPF